MPNDTTDLGSITVTGQRRSDAMMPFPSLPDPITNWDAEIGGEAPEPSPCDDPDTKREWNNDAAASEAKRQMEALAAGRGEQLGHREQAVVTKEGAGGSVGLGNITMGDLGTGHATFDLTGVTGLTLSGMIHNHPGGTLRPSAFDWAQFDTMKNWIRDSGGNPDNLRMYIIAQTFPPGGGPGTWRIFVYDDRNREGSEPGPEVNPNALPC